MSQEFFDKVEHIRGAVAHHVDLKTKTTAADQTKLTKRYLEQLRGIWGTNRVSNGWRRVRTFPILSLVEFFPREGG